MTSWPEKIESDIKSVDNTMSQIMGMFDNTLSKLNSSSLNQIPHNPTNELRSSCNLGDYQSINFGESIKTITPVKTKRSCFNRRKNINIFTLTKFTPTLIDDGYAWRKYGQKVILNSKHQRNYYRCSYKLEQGCQATKQVQKTDEDPSMYKIRYKGLHTCNNLQSSPQIIMEDPTPSDNSILLNFETNTIVENNKVATCSPSLINHTFKEGFHLCHLKHTQVSSYDHHTSQDPWFIGLSQVPSERMSMMSSGLHLEDMVSPAGGFLSTCSTHGNEIDDMIENFDFSEFFSELCS